MKMKKILALVLAVMLLVAASVMGTVAWLMDTSEAVKNTFTAGNIEIELDETVDSEFDILPGTEETKDPVVTVKANSEDCWVYIQVQEVRNDAAKEGDTVTHKYVTWNIDTNYWTELSSENGVTTYYANNKYETIGEDVYYNVLAGQKVSYDEGLTKEMIDKLYTDGSFDASKQPELNFKAFAVQAEAGDDAVAAWAKVDPKEYVNYVTP